MSKLKGFTLIELVVVIAIFGIIMTGIMNMISPIQSAATESKVSNSQKTVEESITSYIGESIRYATNLLIVEDGATVGGVTISSPAAAVQAFYNFAPVNSFNETFSYKDTTDANVTEESKKGTKIIVWDTKTEYDYTSSTNDKLKYYGRLLASTGNVDADSITSISNLDPTGTSGGLYMVFGEAFYGPADYYLNISLLDGGTSGGVQLNLSSDYYYSSGQKAKPNASQALLDDSNNSTQTTVQLRNMGAGQYKFNMAVNGTANQGIKGTKSNVGTNGKIVYFVYTTPESEDWTVTSAAKTDSVGSSFTDGKETGSFATPNGGSGSAANTSGGGTTSSGGSSGGNSGSGNSGSGNGGNSGSGDGGSENKTEGSTEENTENKTEESTEENDTEENNTESSGSSGNYAQIGNHSDIKVDTSTGIKLASDQSQTYGVGELYDLPDGSQLMIWLDKSGQYKAEVINGWTWTTVLDYSGADDANAVLNSYGIQVG